MDVEDDSVALCERKLLHWVNSLPLMKCLLVEKLSDLRFGDILLEMIKYVEDLNGNEISITEDMDTFTTRDEIYLSQEGLIKRMRNIVKYIASQSQSVDGEAMFLANDLKCADKILQGNLTYLCGVLSILKRLTEQRTKRAHKASKTGGYVAFSKAHVQENVSKSFETTPKLKENFQNVPLQIKPELHTYTSFPIHSQSCSSSFSSSSPQPDSHNVGTNTKGVLNLVLNQEKYQRKKNRRIRIVGFSSDRFREETIPRSSKQTSASDNTQKQNHRKPWNNSTKVIPRSTSPNKWEKVLPVVEIPRTSTAPPTSQFAREASGGTQYDDANPSLSVDEMAFLKKQLKSTPSSPILGEEKSNESSNSIPNKRIAFEVCNWIHSLGIRLPVDQLFKEKGVTSSNFSIKSAKIFEDGVLLCQLAAILVSRYGKGVGFCNGGGPGSIHSAFKHLVRGVPDKPGMFVIQGCNLRPDQLAQKRHNVLLALETLKEHGFFNIKHLTEDDQAAWNCFCSTSNNNSSGSSAYKSADSVWGILSHIKSHVKLIEKQQQQHQRRENTQPQPQTFTETIVEEEKEHEQVPQPRLDNVTSQTKQNTQQVQSVINHVQHDEDAILECESSVTTKEPLNLINFSKRKPYITSEQIQAVQKWLHSIPELSIQNIETHKSCSLLQDPIRNGVLLCELVLHFQITSSMAFIKTPKTLRDIGENLSRVFGYLRRLKWFPSVYFVSTEAVAMGDHQIIWGILWHFWQYVEQQKCCAMMATMVISPSLSPVTSPLAHSPLQPPPAPTCIPKIVGETKAIKQFGSPQRQYEDQGLLTWMESIGLLPIRKSLKTREVFVPRNLEEMKDWLQNGIVFAELEKLAFFMKQKSEELQGLQSQSQWQLKCEASIHEETRFLSKVKSARLVKQSMLFFHQLLTSNQNLQQINLLSSPKWCEEKILAGNICVITGILREIKLFFDARQKQIYLLQQKQQRQQRRLEIQDQKQKNQRFSCSNLQKRPSPFLLDVPASVLVDEQCNLVTNSTSCSSVRTTDSILALETPSIPSRNVEQQKLSILEDITDKEEEEDIIPVQKKSMPSKKKEEEEEEEESIEGESELLPLQPSPPPPPPNPSPSFSGLNLFSKQLQRPQRQQQQIVPPKPISMPPIPTNNNTSMNTQKELGPSLSSMSTTSFVNLKPPKETSHSISASNTSKILMSISQQEQQEQVVEVRDPTLTTHTQTTSSSSTTAAAAATSDAVTTAALTKTTTIKKNIPKELLKEDYFSPTASQDLLKWFKRLGIRLEHPELLTDPTKSKEPLLEFQSGVLLCKIVQKVEFLRTIEGICFKPHKKPNALYNISKALCILQQKKTMPLYLLRRKMDIYEGKRQVILPLLHQIRKAYGHHYGPVAPTVSSREHHHTL